MRTLSESKDLIHLWGEIIIAAIVTVAFIWVHYQAGLTFPVPWPDESCFLWQSISVAEQHQLFSETINPNRSIFWMPPLQIIVYGLIFKLTGTSLEAARHISMFFTLGAFYCLVAICRRFAVGLYSVLFCAVFLLGADFIVTGNSARMDPMLMFTVCLGFLLLFRRRWASALAIMLIGPLIHPNGVYFLVGALAYCLFSEEVKQWRSTFDLTARILLAISILCWLTYISYIVVNWADFVSDMIPQFQRKAGRGLVASVFNYRNLLIALSFWWFMRLRKKLELESVTVLYFAFTAWIVFKMGHERWYSVFGDIFGLLYSLLVLDVFHRLLRKSGRFSEKLINRLLLPSAALLILLYGVWQGRLTGYTLHVEDMEWCDMRIDPSVEYLSRDDMDFIANRIDSLCVGSSPVVRFFPSAESILYHDTYPNKWSYSDPIYSEERADIYVVHLSRHLPEDWDGRIDFEWNRIFGDSATIPDPVRVRDSTELWYMVQADRPASDTSEEAGS